MQEMLKEYLIKGNVEKIQPPAIHWVDLKGKSAGNHRFSHEILDFPVVFPLNQPIELQIIGQTAGLDGS